MLKRSYKKILYILILPLFFVLSCAASNPAGSVDGLKAVLVFINDNNLTGNQGSEPPVSDSGYAEDDRTTQKRTFEEKLQESVIVIDPGHGGDDYGTCWGKVFEKDINLDISLKLGALLKQAGVKVVFTRVEDVFIGLRKRTDIANEIGAELFISIHNNGTDSKDSSLRGTETLYYAPEEYKDARMNSQKLAEIVQKNLVDKLGTNDNGIVSRPKLAVLRHANMPSIIAEVGYISNASDREKLSSPEFRQQAAEALSSAVIDALRILYEDEPGNGQ